MTYSVTCQLLPHQNLNHRNTCTCTKNIDFKNINEHWNVWNKIDMAERLLQQTPPCPRISEANNWAMDLT